jgi:hypothetical protein
MKFSPRLWLLSALVIFSTSAIKSKDCDKSHPFRGFIIDAPRCVENMEYYFRLVDFCHEKEFNAIIFRLTDDQGSAYRFTSHPELNLTEGAFTAEELRGLITYAMGKGIEMIPEIESFGHARYITGTRRYAFLNDGIPGEDFNALCPVSDTTLALMHDLYAEITSVFPSCYVHIGCDEVNWGAGEDSRQALKTRSRNQIWAAYVNKLNGFVKSFGKTSIIWGDVPVYQQPEILGMLDKDMVIMDWNYRETNRDTVNNIANRLLDKGFKIIGCPAANWCLWGPRMGVIQFDNLNSYADVYGNTSNPGNLGIIISNWVPKRYLQNSQWDSYDIAADIVNHKGHLNYLSALPEFVRNHFGATWNTSWEKMFSMLYEHTPEWQCGEKPALQFFPWNSEEQVKKIIVENRPVSNSFTEIARLAAENQQGVSRNRDDFDELRLTIEFMEYNYSRHNDLLEFANSKKTDLKSVQEYLKKVANADQIMMTRISRVWSKGRRSKPMKDDKEFMWSFGIAADFSAQLNANPGKLISILKAKP